MRGLTTPDWFLPLILAGSLALSFSTAAQESGSDAEDLAMQLANPISSLISLPFQYNWDTGIGPQDGDRHLLNIQPVIPFSLNDEWNVISRTILPVVHLSDVPAGNSETGFGDVVQSVFFSPKAPSSGGWIWGVGPVFLLPTASDDTLGLDEFGLGPTFVALKQAGPWTYGALVNHIWDVSADNGNDINATFLQPFLNYTTPTGRSFFVNFESTYDWESDEINLPLNVGMNQVMAWGTQRIQLGGGLRYYFDTPFDQGPDWGLRFNFVLLFPR